jgi:hypothetical protein
VTVFFAAIFGNRSLFLGCFVTGRAEGVERGCGRCVEEEGQTMPVVMVIMQQNAELGVLREGQLIMIYCWQGKVFA